jgi:hypothetical protein
MLPGGIDVARVNNVSSPYIMASGSGRVEMMAL